VTWEMHPPFWAPGVDAGIDVPGVFRLGGRWYLAYHSTTNGLLANVYRSAESLAGPWRAPGDGQLDSALFFGTGNAMNGQRVFQFGWIAQFTAGQPNPNPYYLDWGSDKLGTPRELLPAPDGGLYVRCPPEIKAQFAPFDHAEVALQLEPGMGEWIITHGAAECAAPGNFAYAMLPPGPDPCLIEAEITFERGTRRVGFLVRTDKDHSRGHLLYLEPQVNRVVLDRWPRPTHEAPLLSRALELEPGRPVKCQVLLSGDMLEAFIDDVMVLSTREVGCPPLASGLLVQEGRARFTGVAQRPVRMV